MSNTRIATSAHMRIAYGCYLRPCCQHICPPSSAAAAPAAEAMHPSSQPSCSGRATPRRSGVWPWR